jgi:hypothetical protein
MIDLSCQFYRINMRILMVLDREVNQPQVLPQFIEGSALVLGLKYCQDGGEPILERMAVNHDRAAGPTHGPSGGVAELGKPTCLTLRRGQGGVPGGVGAAARGRDHPSKKIEPACTPAIATARRTGQPTSLASHPVRCSGPQDIVLC